MKTNKEAWLIIAEWFDNYHETGNQYLPNEYKLYGLCGAVEELKASSQIEETQRLIMIDRIVAHRREIESKFTYLFPCRQEFAKQRADLARKFAEVYEN